ncbi:MAG TPA: hypothetical protein PLS20_03620 [Ruminococcus flavefaciens]|nr:hypothetical protein [Ruminococcus flavefaciens]
MEYYSRPAWVDVSQKFFEAYIKFRLEGIQKHLIEHNNRNIEISFFDHVDFVSVELYCPEIIRSLSGCYDGSSQNTEELIRMILWLTLDVEELEEYKIQVTNSEEAFVELKDILVEKYGYCYEDTIEESWKGKGDVSFIIELYDRRINIYFTPHAMWEDNGCIEVYLYCFDTGINCSMVVDQEEADTECLINLIHDMALEPEIIEFNISDSEWEHSLIRDALVGRLEDYGLHIVRYPFNSLHYIWEGDIIGARYIKIHNRLIQIQFEQNDDNLVIIPQCLTTGKSYELELPKESKRKEIEDLCEELVYKIQELAWENA